MSDAVIAIQAEGLGKTFWDGDRRLDILKDVSLTIHSGEAVSILGPSGSGKTTLLNLLSGLDAPTAGQVRVRGVSLSTLRENQKASFRNRTVGFIFQFYHLLSEFNAIENVMLPSLVARVSPKKAHAKAERLLKRVGLSDRMGHFPSQLSGGEQQRVAIARALINDPEILFCDEPTGNLDRVTAQQIAGLLMDFHRTEKKTLVMVTHDERMAGMGTRIWNIEMRGWSNGMLK